MNTNTQIKALNDQRRAAQTQLRAIYEAAGNRELTQYETSEETRLGNVIEDCEQRAANLLERAAGEERAIAAAANHPVNQGGGTARPAANHDAEIRELALRGGAMELPINTRAMATVTSGAGQEHVGATYDRDVFTVVTASSGILREARKHQTNSGEPLVLPTITAVQTADEEVSEGATISDDDPTTGNLTLGAWKYAITTKVSNELLSDSFVDFESIINETIGKSLAVAIAPKMATGAGTTEPQGIVTGSSVGTTAAATTAVTANELVELRHSVASEIRALEELVWFMSDETWEAVSKLQDSENRYLIGDLARGADQILLGHRVVLDNSMPSMAAGNKPIIFAAPSYFRVRIAGGLRLEASREEAFSEDQTVFKGVLRLDSGVIDSAGVKALQMAAS